MRSDPDSFVSGLLAGAATVGAAWIAVTGAPVWAFGICAFIIMWTAWAESQ